MPLSARLTPPPVQPQFGLFHDIAVVPPSGAYAPGRPGGENELRCGPVFPNHGVEPWMRHCVANRVIDLPPPAPQGVVERIDRPCVWLGYQHVHFGHLVAEHLSRALWSRTFRPDDLYLFALAPRQRLKRADFILPELFAWYGLPARQLRQVTQPLQIAELRVYPQAELFLGAGPAADYLDLLDRHVAASDLRPRQSDLLFVTRDGMLSRRSGSHAGEGYLCGLLARTGVAVLDPARATLRAQLSAYAGARRIIFSEGSAQHGRQLLGRFDQDIVILNRRPGQRIGQEALVPRCATLRYVEASAHMATPTALWGEKATNDALCFYDVAALHATFAEMGVALGALWDDAAYGQAVRSDAAIWVRQMSGGGRGYDTAILQATADDALVGAGIA